MAQFLEETQPDSEHNMPEGTFDRSEHGVTSEVEDPSQTVNYI